MRRILIWTAGVTGFVLVFGTTLALKHRSNGKERRRQIAELTHLHQVKTQARDYPAAWSSLEQALSVAESAGILARLTDQLKVETESVRTAQEDLAMAWVDELRVHADQKYSPVTDSIAPVLTRGANTATGTRKANLLAHLGWAMFFKSLDGGSKEDPTAQYQAALAADAANPYAHAYLGHWIAWTGGSLDDAMKEFNAGLATESYRVFVRRVQREALRKRAQEAEPALIAVATDMRRNGEKIEASLKSDIDAVYNAACGSQQNDDGMRKLLAAVPAPEQVVTYRRLFYDLAGRILDPSREVPHDACLATLLEAAGQPEDARQVWRRIRKELGTHSNAQTQRADAAIRRLRTR